jgi:hypothetical protein
MLSGIRFRTFADRNRKVRNPKDSFLDQYPPLKGGWSGKELVSA